jgi:hypothetical protein
MKGRISREVDVIFTYEAIDTPKLEVFAVDEHPTQSHKRYKRLEPFRRDSLRSPVVTSIENLRHHLLE